MYLQEKSQDLKVAKRIYFHLVENEEDADFPFAFLATYIRFRSLGLVGAIETRSLEFDRRGGIHLADLLFAAFRANGDRIVGE